MNFRAVASALQPLIRPQLLVLAVAAVPLVARAQAPAPGPGMAAAAAPAAPQPLPAAAPPANEANRIVEVRIEGNHATEVSKLPKLVTRAGQIFDAQAIEEDVRTLHRSRKFVDVHPKYVRVKEGVVVIFQVVERPMLRYVKYVGNEKVTTRTLRKKSEIDVGDSMDPYVVEEARRRIESFYHEKGYDAARVSTVEGSKPGDKGAVFLIDEGRSRKSLWTGFVGNTIASDARLLTQIKSKPGVFWLLGGDVDREKIDADVDALTAYYRSLGFFQAKVGRELEVVHGAGKDWTLLTFVISEGPRYSVRNISFIGNSKFKSEFLARELKLKSGEPFNQAKMDVDLGQIRDIYGGRGFVFADIRADPRFLEEPGQLDLVYNVTEGQRYRVGKINVRIRGDHPHTKHSTILNRLSLRPGDILDIRKLRDDERRLKSSSLFLADAAKGEGPRIVFSKPENAADANEQIARDPSQPGFRGQSPDPASADDAVLDVVLEGELLESGTVVQPTPAPTAAPVPQAQPRGHTPPASVAGTVWRGQSPQPFVQQQPAPAQGWGGAPLAPAGPETLDYSRTVAPPPPVQPPVYVAQQPMAPPPGLPQAVPPGGFQPGFAPAAPGVAPGMVQPFPGQPFGQPGMVAQPGMVPPFAADQPLQVFPGTEPYVIVDVDAEETQTGRLMIGAGVNSNAGLVGNIVVDEQNFDLFRLPQSWDDI
jgi:outer membrane protein insertion porin family